MDETLLPLVVVALGTLPAAALASLVVVLILRVARGPGAPGARFLLWAKLSASIAAGLGTAFGGALVLQRRNFPRGLPAGLVLLVALVVVALLSAAWMDGRRRKPLLMAAAVAAVLDALLIVALA